MRQQNDHQTHGFCRRRPFGARTNRPFALLAASCALLTIMLATAQAATQVVGQQDDLQINTQGASIREILDALSAKFKLTYKLPASVNGTVTGHYSGTLRKALTRILIGNDYFLEISDDSVEVVILGASHTNPVAPAAPAVAENETTIAGVTPATPVPAPAPVPSQSKASPPPLSKYISRSGQFSGH